MQIAKSELAGLVVVAALLGGCGTVGASREAVEVAGQSATVHFGSAPQAFTFDLHEPAGVILGYRLSAPRGATVRGSAQLPGITVPLLIATTSVGPSSACSERGSRVGCAVGEEGCPIPEGTWRFRVDKASGPAGDVVVWFRVGKPPGRTAA